MAYGPYRAGLAADDIGDDDYACPECEAPLDDEYNCPACGYETPGCPACGSPAGVMMPNGRMSCCRASARDIRYLLEED